MNKVEEILKLKGPMLSGDLARAYENYFHVSNQTARQALSRTKSPVCKYRKIKFSKNQVFFYLQNQYNSQEYKEALKKAIKEHSRLYYSYIDAILSQNGVISKKILPAYTYSPIKPVKGHRLYDSVAESLVKANFITEFNEQFWSINTDLFDNRNYDRAIGLEIAKKIIISDFNKWAKETNLVAFNKGKTLFDEPEFGKFGWCYTAPSYIQPLYSIKDNSPGFVVADVIFGRKATLNNINFFIEKLNIIRSFKNIPNFLPVLLVQSIEADALQLLKEKKAMVVIISQFFGEEYVELLEELVNLFANTTSILNKNPQMIYELFEKLERNNGRYNNMAGDLFELLVGSYYSGIGVSFLKSKVTANNYDEGRYKEIDLLVEKDGKMIAIECKAKRARLDIQFVERWISVNIPHIRKWIQNNYPGRNIEFQLWSVSGYDDESLELLKSHSESAKKYNLKYYNYDEMISLAKESNSHEFIDVMRSHFGKSEI